jgi:hypothetical protein
MFAGHPASLVETLDGGFGGESVIDRNPVQRISNACLRSRRPSITS